MPQDFARYVAARFAGHIVLFSPSMDHVYDPRNDQVGAALHKYTNHLVTQHPATNFEAAKSITTPPTPTSAACKAAIKMASLLWLIKPPGSGR